MGVPTLKRKQELNYRRGSAASCCARCNHFIPDVEPYDNVSIDKLAKLQVEHRCRIIGDEPGRAYRVARHAICDAYEERVKP